LSFIVKNQAGVEVVHLGNRLSGVYPSSPPGNSGEITCILRSSPFVPGRYTVDLYFGNSDASYEEFDVIENATSFDAVLSKETLPDGVELDPYLGKRGVIVLPAEWRFKQDRAR
jgi:hypothetical protein